MIRTVVAILAAGMIPSFSAVTGPPKAITVLELKEPSGIGRENCPVTTGVQLPEGALKKAGDAVLLDADGKPVPAQFEALSRWTPGNNTRIHYTRNPPLGLFTAFDLSPSGNSCLLLNRRRSYI